MAERKAGEGSHPVLHYYLQDELGSPVRVSGYHTNHKDETGTDITYLTYGYDEFGNDLYSDLEEAGIPNPYSRQGEEQPFGYTGYRYDEISGTYFAQAREYQPKNGRFTAEDVIKGNGAVPETLNRYGYCWSMPLSYVDMDGRDVYYFYDPKTYKGDKVEKEVEADSIILEEYYNTEVHKIPLDSEGRFFEEWNNMPDSEIDAVVIYSHSRYDRLVIGTDVLKEQSAYGDYNERIEREQIGELESKNINTLILLGCNTGYTNTNDNMVTRFIDDENQLNIQTVIASDGQTFHVDVIEEETKWFFFTKQTFNHTLESKPDAKLHPDGNNDGFKVYYYIEVENNGVKELKLQYDCIGKKFNNIVELLEAGEGCIG